ncbi:hypothetical protein AB5J55_41825 [Streptomyces sp. R11]|uniref:Uncharacterized protein n=1 Tax=Streptomyces sp. R11 TaxID=3238625 RepID=A0AB39NAT1_9ACTN
MPVELPRGDPVDGLTAALIADPVIALSGGQLPVVHELAQHVDRYASVRVHTERAACPRLASLIRWDAAELARTACPGVEGGLEELAQHLGVPLHPGRRPATQEAWAVAQVFRRAIERGAAAGRWSTLAQLEEIAGTAPKPVEEKYLPPPTVQSSLCD